MPADVAFVDAGHGRGPVDRLGLAVQLCTLLWLGFVHDDVALAPAAVVAPFVRMAMTAPPSSVRAASARAVLAAARARGRIGGRPTVVNPDIIRAARDMLPNPETSITTIAKLLGVSPGTLYNHIPDLKELRAGTAVPRPLDGTER